MENIVIKNLNKSFDDKAVLKNFSAEIIGGCVNCIMAPSGAGKTTLIRILMGLEKADSGEIFGVCKNSIRAVFQEDRLVESLTVYTNIKMATEKSPLDISMVLGKLLLKNCENSAVQTMSGGEKRRVSIARALLAKSEMIILDEPFKGLDEDTKSVVMKVVLEYIKGKTVLLITHSEDEAKALSATNYISF